MRGRRTALALAALIAAGSGIAAQATGVLDGAEQATVDARFQLRPAHPPSDLAVVAIDARTFTALRHQWPFPRSWHGQVIDQLRRAGARTIVYDVQFTEPTKPAQDLALYRAVGRAGHAVLATTETDQHGHSNVLGGDQQLARVGARAGAANIQGSAGGTLRRVPFEVGGLPTLAVAAAEATTGRAVPRSTFPPEGALIDFRGPPGTIPTLTFESVRSGHFDRSAVAGKIVVVGASSPTLQDVHPTPTSSTTLMAGPEIQANAIWTLLHGRPLRDLPPALGIAILLLLAVAVPAGALRFRAAHVAAVAIPLAASYAALAQLAFAHGLILPFAVPLATLAIGAVGTIAAAAWLERRERTQVAAVNDELERRVRAATEELRDTQLEVIRRLGQAAEWRDEETGEHIERMSRLCARLAQANGMDEAEADLLHYAAAMHDVGKIGIPDEILLKPGRFTPDERRVMETHTTMGASILAGSRSTLLQLAEEIARTHHERWDGDGYPAGLSGEEIPRAGRIAAICDVFDALTSERPYKDAWSVDEALTEIAAQSGRQFDPELVDAFLTLAPQLRAEAVDQPAPKRLRVA